MSNKSKEGEKISLSLIDILVPRMRALIKVMEDLATWLVMSECLKVIEGIYDKLQGRLEKLRYDHYAKDEDGNLLTKVTPLVDEFGKPLKQVMIIEGKETEVNMTQDAPYIKNVYAFNEAARAIFEEEVTIVWPQTINFKDIEAFPLGFRDLQHELMHRIIIVE